MRIELAPDGDTASGHFCAKTPASPRATDLLIDANGMIIEASPILLSRLERRLDEVRGKSINGLIPGFDAAVLAAVQRGLSAMPVHISAICGRRGGHSTFLTLKAYPGSNPATGTEHIRLVATDEETTPSMDERQHIQSRLDRAERLETAGTVAGQIAHDFNNLLTPLIAYPQLIRKAIPAGSPALEFLSLMEKTAKDMSHLTQQLLSLSRRGQVGRDVFNLQELIERVIGLISSSVPPGITIHHQTISRPMDVKGSRDQMLRVIQNICQNAIDAMGETGTLTIVTDNIYLDAPFGQYEMVNTGEYVKISFTDTGCGIPDAIKDRIFDPFFTTKKADKKRGSGLGLSIVHGILKDHGGYIDLESQVARGTTFTVYIPTHRDIQAGETVHPKHPTNRRILVIDDDAIQVTLLCDMLKSSGFQAIGAHSGEEGMRLLRDGKNPIDLVLLDLIMLPGMDGLDTYRAIHRLNAALPVLLMSGYNQAAPKVLKAQQEGAGPYLAKPIEQILLARTVAQALGIPLPSESSGSTFPTQPATVPAPISPSTTQTGSTRRQRRILLADDDKLIRKLFALIISTEFKNTRIDQAADGEEAINLFKAQPYDLLVLDLQMPRVAGREAALEIQRYCAQHNLPEPPIIFCTGFAPPESLSQIVGDGSRHTILRKPVRVDDLLAAIHDRF
jgi:signal transduction histidine kinase/DNA-binding response OmpR family regulator